MRAFPSHSCVGKTIVSAVHAALEKESTWLDRAEIEFEMKLLSVMDNLR